LLGYSDGRTGSDIDLACLRFEFSGYHLEDGTFAGTVLTHEGDFGILSDRKTRFCEDRSFFVFAVLECNVIKTEYDRIL
jgi:hypothetical protein